MIKTVITHTIFLLLGMAIGVWSSVVATGVSADGISTPEVAQSGATTQSVAQQQVELKYCSAVCETRIETYEVTYCNQSNGTACEMKQVSSVKISK